MYPEFIVGTYMNSDIGYAHDDYIGCSPENDLIFGYNAIILMKDQQDRVMVRTHLLLG